ncbi:ABC transporter ATP-binding protein, partial [Methylobacterium sp. CG08_land_8_20_14_0_20_71_15]
AAAAGLLAGGLARLLVLRRAAARATLRRSESAAAEGRLLDLVQRMPAVRAHGTRATEARRLDAQARATKDLLARAEARLAYARTPALVLAAILPAIGLAAALWRGSADAGAPRGIPVEPGAFVAATGAFAVALILMAAGMRVLSARTETAPLFAQVARLLDGLSARRRGMADRPVPRSGLLAARGAGGYDPASGERLAGVDLALPMPSHAAITGGRGSGARVLAALLSGQVEPSAGSLTYDGVEMRSFEPSERARRIALAQGEAILVEGSLRENILYGAQAGDAAEGDLVTILRLTGLDAFAYTRGLVGRVDPAAQPELAGALVAARRLVRAALAADGAERLVEPFDPALYNHQATVGENILFGEAVGPTFAGEALAAHPYLRAVLEAEELTRPLSEIGLQVARSTVEIFADLPADHPLFDAFSLFPASERGYFEDLVGRQADASAWRRGPAGQRDRDRLIGLALRYSETRHRFGLIDGPFEERIVEARRSFARMLPPHLSGTIEFYDPDRVNVAASLEENLLFGRIAYGEAGAEARVRGVARRVLAEQGLERAVYRLGLDSRLDPRPSGGALGEGSVGSRERVAIDLARCLARRPDILVVAILDERGKADDVRERLDTLRAARTGLGLVVCLPEGVDPAELAPFDAVIAVERNTVAAVTVPADARPPTPARQDAPQPADA